MQRPDRPAPPAAPNYFLKDSNCVTSGNCGAGFFADTAADPDACAACEANCAACSDRTTCTTCSANYFLKDSNCVTSGNCGAGFFADTAADPDACAACEANCAACSDASTCTACSSPNYFLKDSNCVTSGNCGAGFFADTAADPDACAACEANCAACSDRTTCTTCSANYFLKDSNCVTSGNCGAGFFADTAADPDACAACEANCAACSDASTCTMCSTNYFIEINHCSPSVCTTPITAGYSFSAQSGDNTMANFDVRGLACAAGYAGTVKATSCTEHNDAYFVTGCTSCGAGKYQDLNNADTTTCKSCAPGKYSDAGALQTAESVCKPCGAGSYQDATGSVNCKACAPGRYSTAGQLQTTADVCQICDPGKYSDSSGSTLPCNFCAAGFAFVRSDAVCEGCPPGRYQDENDRANSACAICEGGTFANTSNTPVCKNCPAGKNLVVVATDATLHDEAEDCQLCEAGKYNFQPGLQIACFDCETALQPGATACDGCNPGTFKESGGSDCIECTVGRYSSTRDAEVCTDCPKGYHGVEVTATQARIECGTCPRGTFGDVKALENITRCKVCAAGRYSEVDALPAGASVPCKECPTGRWSAATGLQESVGCKNCDAGRYSTSFASTSETACLPCSAGRHSATVGLSDPSQCRACPEGYSQLDEGQAFCLQCVPGQHQNQEGQPSCKLCAANHFANETEMTKCHVCAIGTVADNQGSASCSSCAAGEFGEPGPVCTKCGEGRFRQGDASSALWCEACPKGFYQDATGQAACLPCVPGKYQDERNSSACRLCAANHFTENSTSHKCRLCPSGRSAQQGSVECSTCGTGTVSVAAAYPDMFTCTACAPGSVAQAGDNQCAQCAPGLYQASSGQATCDACSVGRWSSSVGSSQPTTCTNCSPGRYSSAEGASDQSACNACAPGKSNNVTGANSSDACTDCSHGRSSLSGMQSCDRCRAGFYQDATGQAACLPCVPGKYQDERNSSACKLCAANHFANETEMTKCHVCAIGTVARSPGAAACQACIAGTYGASCSKCPPGRYRTGDDSDVTQCRACPAGFNQPENGTTYCLGCDAGRFADSSASARVHALPHGHSRPREAYHRCRRLPALRNHRYGPERRTIRVFPTRRQRPENTSSVSPELAIFVTVGFVVLMLGSAWYVSEPAISKGDKPVIHERLRRLSCKMASAAAPVPSPTRATKIFLRRLA